MADLFLPPPRDPLMMWLPVPPASLFDDLAPDGGRHIRNYLELQAQAREASTELEDCRPGGTKWAQALDADADTARAGREPQRWQVEDLLDGDHARWARASALCRTLAERVRVPMAEAAADKVLRARMDVKERQLREEAGRAAEAAWTAVARGAPQAESWTLLAKYRETVDRMCALDAADAWLEGDRARVQNPGATVSGETLGFAVAASIMLGEDRPVEPPAGILWPADFPADKRYPGNYADAVAKAYSPRRKSPAEMAAAAELAAAGS